MGRLNRGRADLEPLDPGAAAQVRIAMEHERGGVADRGRETRVAWRNAGSAQVRVKDDMCCGIAGFGARDGCDRSVERLEVSVRQMSPRQRELDRCCGSLDRAGDAAVEDEAADRPGRIDRGAGLQLQGTTKTVERALAAQRECDGRLARQMAELRHESVGRLVKRDVEGKRISLRNVGESGLEAAWKILADGVEI